MPIACHFNYVCSLAAIKLFCILYTVYHTYVDYSVPFVYGPFSNHIMLKTCWLPKCPNNSYAVSLCFVKDLARMRINLAASGITLPNLVNAGSQTPADDEEIESEDEPDQRGFSHSSLNEESDGSRAGSSLVAEVVITEPSPLVGDSMDETDVLSPQTIRKSSKKQKRKKQTRKDRSRKQTASLSPYPDVNRDDGRYDNTRKDADDDVMESTICSKMSVKMQNKVVLDTLIEHDETLLKGRKSSCLQILLK